MYFILYEYVCICICIKNAMFCRSAAALMEVERATPPGFEEEILKPPEVTITMITITILFIIILITILFIMIMIVTTLTQAPWGLFNHLPNHYDPL